MSTTTTNRIETNNLEFNFSVTETITYSDEEEGDWTAIYHIDQQPTPATVLRLTSNDVPQGTEPNTEIRTIMMANANELTGQDYRKQMMLTDYEGDFREPIVCYGVPSHSAHVMYTRGGEGDGWYVTTAATFLDALLHCLETHGWWPTHMDAS